MRRCKVWRWWSRQTAGKQSDLSSPLISQNMTLYREIKEAEHNWRLAEQRLNEAVEKDQIDYAIYTLEAAEKRYDMLLRQAKQQKLKIGFAEWAQRLVEEQERKGGTR